MSDPDSDLHQAAKGLQTARDGLAALAVLLSEVAHAMADCMRQEAKASAPKRQRKRRRQASRKAAQRL